MSLGVVVDLSNIELINDVLRKAIGLSFSHDPISVVEGWQTIVWLS